MYATDVSKVAYVHSQIFVDYFLTHLGQRFLECFYQQFVERSGNYGLVASYDEKIVGFVVGTTDSAELYRHFYRQNFVSLALILIGRFSADSFVRRSIMSRMVHMRLALQSLVHRSQPRSTKEVSSTNSSAASSRLLSIGVLPEVQGYGIADKLAQHFCERLYLDNVSLVGLSVRMNNDRAIAFYEKTGWKRERVSETTIYFIREL